MMLHIGQEVAEPSQRCLQSARLSSCSTRVPDHQTLDSDSDIKCRDRGGAPWWDDGLWLDRTYCESDLSAMHDFFGEDAKEIQDAGQCGRVAAEGSNNVCENVLPFRHLDGQVCQADTECQADGLGPCMERCQVAHNGGAKLGQLLAGHLVQVVYNLDGLEGSGAADSGQQRRTLPLSVVAANSLAAASTELDSSMARVAVHASCCGAPCQRPALV
jgi:hypothetical protein